MLRAAEREVGVGEVEEVAAARRRGRRRAGAGRRPPRRRRRCGACGRRRCGAGVGVAGRRLGRHRHAGRILRIEEAVRLAPCSRPAPCLARRRRHRARPASGRRADRWCSPCGPTAAPPCAETTLDAPARAPMATAVAAATLHSNSAPRRGPRVGVRSEFIDESFGLTNGRPPMAIIGCRAWRACDRSPCADRNRRPRRRR